MSKWIKQGLYTPDGMHRRSRLNKKFGCKKYGKQFYCFEECPFPDCLECFGAEKVRELVEKEKK